MRTLFVGMSGQFSHIVLARLLAHGVNVVAVLLPGPRNIPLRAVFSPACTDLPQQGRELDLPILNPAVISAPAVSEQSKANRGSGPGDSASYAPRASANPLALAANEGIPAYECGKVGHQETTGWLKELALDVVCVACWNSIIPPPVLEIPRYGFLNVHPSLLPAYRGPFPLFWQFRNGETATGVTVHWMDSGLDSGDIAGQREIRFNDGIRGASAEALCAKSGGDLLAEVLAVLSRGDEIRQPQPSGGTYYPAPSHDDFTLDSNWHTRRVFNFMRATAEWGIPFSVEADGRLYRLSDAIEWQEDASTETPDCGKVWASFQGGSVLAEEWPD
ncbi:MAG: formyltransferase family protein [Caldilineaceae bacterium]|nr:formyltransferase family protein [Caldilineaceae bacterium]